MTVQVTPLTLRSEVNGDCIIIQIGPNRNDLEATRDFLSHTLDNKNNVIDHRRPKTSGPSSLKILSVLLWLRISGYVCLVTYLWLRMSGYVSLATYLWLRIYGYVSLATYLWLRISG